MKKLKKYAAKGSLLLMFLVVLVDVTFVLAKASSRKPRAQQAKAQQVKAQPVTEQVKAVNYREVKMNVSAYCPCDLCCGKYGWGYKTACGHKIKAGECFVAAPKNYAFGTIMSIPGYVGGSKVQVLDRGGAIKGNHLDVYFSDHKTALRWGRQNLVVRVYDVK